MLKKYSLSISIVYSVILALASFLKVNGVTQAWPSNSDKVFHGLAYLIFTVLWFITFFLGRHYSKRRALIFAGVSAFIFGVIIEVLQGAITQNRQSDVNDVIANTIGMIIAVIIIISIKKGVLKNNNTLLL